MKLAKLDFALVVLRVGFRLQYGKHSIADRFSSNTIKAWSPCRRNNPLVSICAAGVGNIDVNHCYRCARDIPCWWSHPHRVSLVPNAQSSRPRLNSIEERKRNRMRRCPRCDSGEVRRSKRRGLTERYLLSAIALKPFRCQNCGNRFFRWPVQDLNGRLFSALVRLARWWRCSPNPNPARNISHSSFEHP